MGFCESGAPPTGAGAWPGRVMVLPRSVTSPVTITLCTPVNDCIPSICAIEAGFHHSESTPVSAPSPE